MGDYVVFRCKYYSPDGVCELFTDDEVTEYCVEGPCTSEENEEETE